MVRMFSHRIAEAFFAPGSQGKKPDQRAGNSYPIIPCFHSICCTYTIIRKKTCCYFCNASSMAYQTLRFSTPIFFSNAYWASSHNVAPADKIFSPFWVRWRQRLRVPLAAPSSIRPDASIGCSVRTSVLRSKRIFCASSLTLEWSSFSRVRIRAN